MIFFYDAAYKISSTELKLEVCHQKPWLLAWFHLSKYFRRHNLAPINWLFYQQVSCICLISLCICQFKKHRSHGGSPLKKWSFLAHYFRVLTYFLSYPLFGVPHLFNLYVVTWTQNIGSALVCQTVALLLTRQDF